MSSETTAPSGTGIVGRVESGVLVDVGPVRGTGAAR
jgi:hypothetical protein